MPTLTRWFVKAALAYFVVALLLGLLIAARGVLQLPAIIGSAGPVYFHLLMVGWVTQLIFGVAYWMFPVLSRDRLRGYDWLGWAAFWLLNSGLILRVLFEPMLALRPGPATGWPLVASALFQWLAGLAFVVNTWGRVKGK
jgi:hypothetical protein